MEQVFLGEFGSLGFTDPAEAVLLRLRRAARPGAASTRGRCSGSMLVGFSPAAESCETRG